jgi:hypothetical protein
LIAHPDADAPTGTEPHSDVDVDADASGRQHVARACCKRDTQTTDPHAHLLLVRRRREVALQRHQLALQVRKLRGARRRHGATLIQVPAPRTFLPHQKYARGCVCAAGAASAVHALQAWKLPAMRRRRVCVARPCRRCRLRRCRACPRLHLPLACSSGGVLTPRRVLPLRAVGCGTSAAQRADQEAAGASATPVSAAGWRPVLAVCSMHPPLPPSVHPPASAAPASTQQAAILASLAATERCCARAVRSVPACVPCVPRVHAVTHRVRAQMTPRRRWAATSACSPWWSCPCRRRASQTLTR